MYLLNSVHSVYSGNTLLQSYPLFTLKGYLFTHSSPHCLFRDEYLAYKAALFFCINPASVLFTSPMTLSLLAASSFAALASIEKGMGLFSGVYLAMANAAHPSALFGLLMVLHSSMRQVATQTILLGKLICLTIYFQKRNLIKFLEQKWCEIFCEMCFELNRPMLQKIAHVFKYW